MKEQLKMHEQNQDEKYNENVDHFVRIQELFNKVQIDNKGLRSMNGKLDT